MIYGEYDLDEPAWMQRLAIGAVALAVLLALAVSLMAWVWIWRAL